MIGLAVVASLLVLVTGCWPFNTAPTASFTASASSGVAPLTVSFSAILSHDSDGIIVTYEWDFGDGGSGSGKSASHTYAAAGTFTVVLQITDDNGALATAQKTITVSEATGGDTGGTGPTASFTATPLVGASPLTVTFNASASAYAGHAITYFSWNFGDGVTGTGITTSHTYSPSTTNTYHVVLRIIASDNTEGTATKDILVTTSTPTPGTNNPTASFTTAPNKVIAPKRIICDGGNSAAVAGRTLTEWIWRFGDGTSPSSLNTDAPVQHRYTTDRASETFTVTLIVIDDEDGTDTEQRTVTVENKQPVAGFEIDDKLGGGGTWQHDNVTFPDTGLLQTDSATVQIQSAAPAAHQGTTPTTNDEDNANYDEPSPKTAVPTGYADHNFSYDPEGQGWSGDTPDGFPNVAWGIEWYKVDWGDGNTVFVSYSAGLAPKTHSYTGLSVGVNNFTITVTAIDYLGAETSYSRTVTINRTS